MALPGHAYRSEEVLGLQDQPNLSTQNTVHSDLATLPRSSAWKSSEMDRSISSASDHVIFKVCVRCGFNTKDRPVIEDRDSGFFCPKCDKLSFVTACTICAFKSTPVCPLYQLLVKRPAQACPLGSTCILPEHDENLISGRKVEVPALPKNVEPAEIHGERRGRSQQPLPVRVKPAETNDELERNTKLSSADIVKRYKASRKLKPDIKDFRLRSPLHMRSSPRASISPSTRYKQELQQTSRTEHQIKLSTAQDSSSDTFPEVCEQCTQPHCASCQPGYMNLVVDMKEFSITFASAMRLCTMCEHWLCPGSSLVVLYRCRDCGHEGCDGCEKTEDDFGEEYFDCCGCSKRQALANMEDLK